MDIGQEIINHLEWIENIADLLGKEEVVEEELQAITQHNHCALGHWLDSADAQEFKALPEFEQLVSCHEAFHQLAGRLITALHLGNEAEAIETQEQFVEMSQKVIGYLHMLQGHAGARR